MKKKKTKKKYTLQDFIGDMEKVKPGFKKKVKKEYDKIKGKRK